jgi:prepilin-type N-terminal cleavage/methylation domain-containing protein
MARRGFTLIELMVVITIIAILSTIALFGISKVQSSARDAKRQQTIRGLQTALQRYYGDNASYPSGDWACFIYKLANGGYLASRPTDPHNNCDISCGAGSAQCDNVWGGPGRGTTGWCGCTWEAGYAYSSTGNSYKITFYKAAGGTATFVSPQ